MNLRLGNREITRSYHNVFDSPDGKHVLADLRRRCPFLNDSIAAGQGIDVNKLIYLEGQRSVLLHIYKMLKRDPNMDMPSRAINETTGE